GPLVLHACAVSGNLGGNGSSADGTSANGISGGLGVANLHPNFIYYTRHGGPGGAGGTAGIYSEDSLRMSLCTLSGNLGGAGGAGGLSFGGFMGEDGPRSEEYTSELQSLAYLVCRLLLEKKKKKKKIDKRKEYN